MDAEKGYPLCPAGSMSGEECRSETGERGLDKWRSATSQSSQSRELPSSLPSCRTSWTGDGAWLGTGGPDRTPGPAGEPPSSRAFHFGTHGILKLQTLQTAHDDGRLSNFLITDDTVLQQMASFHNRPLIVFPWKLIFGRNITFGDLRMDSEGSLGGGSEAEWAAWSFPLLKNIRNPFNWHIVLNQSTHFNRRLKRQRLAFQKQGNNSDTLRYQQGSPLRPDAWWQPASRVTGDSIHKFLCSPQSDTVSASIFKFED